MTYAGLAKALILLIPGGALAQDHAARPEFEVAIIKPVGRGSSSGALVKADAGQIHYANVSLAGLIHMAYRPEIYQQVKGPAWIRSEHYELAAKMPFGASKEQIPAMLQSLLTERFHLEMHREKVEASILALVVAKNGPKIRKVQGHDEQWTQKLGPVTELRGKRTIAELVSKLNGASDLAIVDESGLKGNFQIDLKWALAIKDPDPSAPLLAQALQEQAGLRLEPRKIQTENLVVDRADRVPVEQ